MPITRHRESARSGTRSIRPIRRRPIPARSRRRRPADIGEPEIGGQAVRRVGAQRVLERHASGNRKHRHRRCRRAQYAPVLPSRHRHQASAGANRPGRPRRRLRTLPCPRSNRRSGSIRDSFAPERSASCGSSARPRTCGCGRALHPPRAPAPQAAPRPARSRSASTARRDARASVQRRLRVMPPASAAPRRPSRTAARARARA